MRVNIKFKRKDPHLCVRRPATKKDKKNQMVEALVFLVVFFAFFGYLASKMGLENMMNTLMNTAFHLLSNVVFYLMGITVLMGALSSLLAEFGVVQLLEKILRPLMKPLFNLPGVAALGAVLTFLSDNPAIISLSKNKKFANYFRVYQLVSLTNFGTAFGMGLVVVMFMIGLGYIGAPLVGLFGAMCGCLISTRLMQRFTRKDYPEYDLMVAEPQGEVVVASQDPSALPSEQKAEQQDEKQGVFMRVLNAMLSGGKNGVDLGLSIIPGVLIITTLVMILTNDVTNGIVPSGDPITTEYKGLACQGVGLLPYLADKVNFLWEWLFGFTNSQLLAFPMTALGAVGAALGLARDFQVQNILDANAVAVFTAIGMCWSGYLSTHAAMLDSLGYRHLISKAIISHTIAGFCAGVIAHWAWVLVDMCF